MLGSFRVVPPFLEASVFADGRWTNYPSGEVKLSSMDGRPFRILRSHGQEPDFVMFDPDLDPPRSEYTVRWDVRRFGIEIPWFWVFETDHPGAPLVDARIRHVSTQVPRQKGRPWVAKDQRILAGAVRRGEPFEVVTEIEYAGDNPPDPSTAFVQTRSKNMTVKLVEAQRDGKLVQMRIRVTPAGTLEPGLFYDTLSLYASGIEAPLRIIARLQ